MKKILLLTLIPLSSNAYDPDKRDANQEQYQHQKQYQTTESTSTADNNVSFTDELQAPPVYAPSIYPSGNCGRGWSGGLSVPGAGVSFGQANIDENCDARETARMFYQFGERDKAIMILCEQPAAQVLASCKPYQDYNKEQKLLELENQELVEDIDELREQIDNLKEEVVKRDQKVFETAIAK